MISHITNGAIDYRIAIGTLADVLNPRYVKEERISTILNISGVRDEIILRVFRDAGLNIFYKSHPITESDVYPIIDEKGSRINNLDDDAVQRFLEQCELAYCELSRIKFGAPMERVLVNCVAGIDRSPFIVAKYLRDKFIGGWERSYEIIKKCRPFINIHMEWIPDIWSDGK